MKNAMEIVEISRHNIFIVTEFLQLHESACVSLMSRLLNFNKIKNQYAYFIHEKKTPVCIETICGVFLITEFGVLLHFLLNYSVEKYLAPVLRKKNIFSLAGLRDSSYAFEASLPIKPNIVYDYHLMIYTKHQSQPLLNEKKIKEPFILLKCTENDEKSLFDLQMNYQKEEVLPPGKIITEKMCSTLLQKRLKEQDVYAIKDSSNNTYVAMAGTNAKGAAFIQLGGIYTNVAYRNLGLSQALLSALISKTTKNIALFVRKENLAAIKVYTNLGFKTSNTYRICYF